MPPEPPSLLLPPTPTASLAHPSPTPSWSPRVAAGHRFVLPKPHGSADALLLAQFARAGVQAVQGRQLTVIVTAQAQDAQRLAQEMVFFDTALSVAVFPDWETLPYDTFSPHQDLVSERLATLWRVLSTQGRVARTGSQSASQSQLDLDVLLVPASTALTRLAPPAFLAATTFAFKKGERLNEVQLKSQLSLAGYEHVSQVVAPGEYAVRGGLIDLFPMGAVTPYRLDLFDDRVDSIRTFDPDTQRSLFPVPEVRLLPGREFPMDEASRTTFRARWRELLEGDPTRSRIYKDMAIGMATAGIEYYLPLFFKEAATLFDHVGPASQWVLHGAVDEAVEHFLDNARERHRFLQHDPERPILPVAEVFLTREAFFTRLQPHATLSLRSGQSDAPLRASEPPAFAHPLPNLSVERGTAQPLQRLAEHLQKVKLVVSVDDALPPRMVIVAESDGRRESLLELLREHHLEAQSVESLAVFERSVHPVGILTAPLAEGFIWMREGQAPLHLITETELFAAGPSARRKRKQEQVSSVEALIKDLSELTIGDPVVHLMHGIGRYKGLVSMDLQDGRDGGPSEFLHLAYAEDTKLYVPVSQLHLISRYTGVAPDEAPLHRLGSDHWAKAKKRAAEQVRDAAAELLDLYARRAAREGHAHRYAASDYEAFASSFGFEETADQRAAIHAVIQDMISPKPMDRLICGDVGFGKTEVAMRAAFVAVMGGKQVALLAPTTLLAEQHHQNMVDRFSAWPVKVAELSRFRTAKEVQAALDGMAQGSIDIVVGTHKLLSKDIKFSRLGLLVIDEEHRFGVRHKEAIKAMRAEVDVLTLTATPIPRTLGMSLEGLRDLSVIATAPQRRLAIKTFVRTEGTSVIREALLRELKRGGQVFFLHNEVDTIAHRAASLAELMPEARIAVAHGQMPERELERVMRDFVAQRFNVLVCSTIIETGIDVPTANTIVITRADKFGLAQLHQLRGRVGRSHHQAYAYLLVPDVEHLSKQATQRLDAIQQMEELGSGFYLAMHDLEIRGAGEVLGERQSGNMMEVGYQLYSDMLAQAVRTLKSGREVAMADLLATGTTTVDVNLHAPALLPTTYCDDVHVRLSFYKKLATAQTLDAVETLLEELADRFGQPPPAAQTLIDTHRIRVQAKPLGVVKVDAAEGLSIISFGPNPPVDAATVLALIQRHRHIKLVSNERLRIERETPDVRDRAQQVKDLLKALAPTRRA
jgi:transcription-repair coupling factor (superfamily II helicase)